jgi:hypothetical protein
MFSVMNCINKTKSIRGNLEILVIQDGHQEYLIDLCLIPNTTIYSYYNNIDLQVKLPENIVVIDDLDSVFSKSFDYVICFGKTSNAHVSNILKDRFSCSVILLDDTTEETYCIRPFGSSVTNRIDIKYDKKVSLYRSAAEGCVTIPKMKSGIIHSKKTEDICLFDKLHKNIASRYSGVLRDRKWVSFSDQNLAKSRIFLDTNIGITPYLIKAIESSCFIICPYSKEAEQLIGDKGLLYNTFEELSDHIKYTKENDIDGSTMQDIIAENLISKDDFITAWENILRN